MSAFLLVAFALRFFSPIMPDFFSKPFQSAPISNCVQNTPVDNQNHRGTLCGLAYPYQGNMAAAPVAPRPAEGEVFDEIYFAIFAHDDLIGKPFFSAEPPLAKEIIAGGEWLDGAYRAIFQGARGSFADLGFNTFGWRIMSVVFGSLCVPLMYLLALQLWHERWFAIAGATFCGFDGLFFIQSRIAMIDIFPIFFILLAYVLFLIHLKAESQRQSVATLLLVGAVLGLAIAAKWIALAALGSIAFLLVTRPLARHVTLRLNHGEGSLQSGGLPGPSLPGGARWRAYLPAAVAALIVLPVAIYLVSWIPFYLRGQFHSLGDLIAYNEQVYAYQSSLQATHPYGSAWFTWPVLYRPVAYYYYQSLGTDVGTGQPLVAGLVDLGNPLIWWAALPAVISLPYFVLRHRSFPATVILVGFITQYLPWSRITRVIFLYHFFGALIFSVLALAFVLTRMQRAGPLHIDVFGKSSELSTRWIVPVFCSLVVVTFLYFYPIWTGLPISNTAYLGGFPVGKMWLRTWI